MQNEQDLPIDIHSNKLLDWLISRRQCKQDWQKDIKVVREKINKAIQDMPAVDEIMKLLSGTYINYFHCVRIVELLKETDSGKRNIFGQYSSQKMKDWQEIIKLYEKDSIFLAEAAQMLIRNVNYEVPSMKKQIAKCQQLQEECERKQADYIRNSNECKERYQNECKQLGIEGKNIKAELLSLVSELPFTYEKIASSVTDLHDVYQFYSATREFILGRKVENVLSTVFHLMARGNTTVFEFETGNIPLKVEEPQLQLAIEVEKNSKIAQLSEAIDFGDDDDVIDFGIEVASESEGIDFGTNDGNGGSSSSSNPIDWEIVVETNGDSADVLDVNSNVARGDKALTLLDNPSTRNLILDELSELKAFLMQRLQEMQSEGDFLSSNLQTAPLSLQLQTKESIVVMLSTVNQMLSSLTNVKMQNLQLVRSSPRFVDRLVESLEQKQSLTNKMLQSAEAVALRRDQTYEEQMLLEPKVEIVVTRTRELQKQIEKDISKRYKNRPVNIMGGVNTL